MKSIAIQTLRTRCTSFAHRATRALGGLVPPGGVFALFALAGCSSPTEVPPPADAASISMFLEGVHVSRQAIVGMLPGTTLHFAATVYDAGGHSLGSARPTVVSRNTNAISIDSTGLMRVVGRGSSWLVAGYNSASRGLLADSVTVSVVCTTEARPGIQISVTDSLTGVAAGIASLSISARLGNVRDSLFYPVVPAGTGVLSQGLAYERPGTWDVRVTADGYRPWASLGVLVTNDLCHVITVPISARLQRP